MVLSDEEKRKRRRAWSKAYYKKNRESVLAYQRKYNARPENKAKHKLSMSKYQKKRLANPEIRAKHNLANKILQKKRFEPDGENGKIKSKVFAHYSKVVSNSDVPICACCGYSDIRFLNVDHIDGRKNLSVKEKKLQSHYLWKYLIKTGFPSGYQILCYNCNLGKGREKYCPHQLDN